MNWITFLIIVILIIIILIVLNIENFTVEDSDALNNLISSINKNGIAVNDITAGNKIEGSIIGENMKSAIMKVVYPVGSMFISRVYYDLSDKTKIADTPMAYGKWLFINDVGVIGTALKTHDNKDTDGKTGTWGNLAIDISQLPPHAHQLWHANWYDSSDGGHGEESIARWRKHDNVENKDKGDKIDDNQFTKNIIVNVSQKDGKIKGELVNAGKNFHPYGYYCYVYRKISLD